MAIVSMWFIVINILNQYHITIMVIFGFCFVLYIIFGIFALISPLLPIVLVTQIGVTK